MSLLSNIKSFHHEKSFILPWRKFCSFMMERFNVRRLFPWSSENGMLKVAVGGLSIIKIFIQKSLFSNFFVNLHP